MIVARLIEIERRSFGSTSDSEMSDTQPGDRSKPLQARTVATPTGSIRFDCALPLEPDSDWFDPAQWTRRGAEVTTLSAGRGSAWSIHAGSDRYVLRHYRRGGAIRHVLGDRYWFREAEATRGFREFDLLAQLSDEGFSVPRPVAVMYEREGPWYRADLLMQMIDTGRSVHQRLLDGESIEWKSMGRAIAGLHRRGVFHADLNAHNALIDDFGRVWIIDFDKARIRQRTALWQTANLGRLARSLRKLGHAELLAAAWPQLQLGYAECNP